MNVRLRSIFYNTPNAGSPAITAKIEILDTEAVAQVINFECDGSPTEALEGLTQDLKPGIFTSTLKFGMWVRATPKIRDGVTYGPSESFLDDIFSAPEGRFVATYYINDVLQFAGPIIYDQCIYEDSASPYLLSITAVDGLARLKTEKYISEVGQIKYHTFKKYTNYYDNTPLTEDFYADPPTPLPGTEWVILFNVVNHGNPVGNPPLYMFVHVTTYGRYEQYSAVSPGVGWVDQGQGLWAKEITTTGDLETEDVVFPESYSLVKLYDHTQLRRASEYISRAIGITNMGVLYPSPAVMYDVACEWYDNDMGDKELDPLDQMELHEKPFIDNFWSEGLTHLCNLLNLRIYFSNGRYHIEQISLRDGDGFTRFTYESDGTYIGTETPTLDIDLSALSIKPAEGGQYKILQSLRSVEAVVPFDSNNLLDGVGWDDSDLGEKYLGRVKKTSDIQKAAVSVFYAMTSTFDPTILSTLDPADINRYCKHKFFINVSIRIVNIQLGTTYWMSRPDPFTTEWSALEDSSSEFYKLFGWDSDPFTASSFGKTQYGTWGIIMPDLPGIEGAMYDIYMSVSPVIEFQDAEGAIFWLVTNPTKHWHSLKSFDPHAAGSVTTNLFIFYSDVSTTPWTESPSSSGLNKTYYIENNVLNSSRLSTQLEWGDVNQRERGILIYNGTKWIMSSGWSVGGVGDQVDIGELLVTEQASFRTLPRKIYSGSYLTVTPCAENRLLRGTTYYIPLSVSKTLDLDEFAGEFLEIARVTPPDITTIDEPLDAGVGIGGISGVSGSDPDDPNNPIPMGFITDEPITATSTLTEVDIINTDGVFVQNGSVIRILDTTTGLNENVKLTQSILPTDTVMYFESHMFVNSLASGSQLSVVGDIVTLPTNINQIYQYFSPSFTGTEIAAPNFPFVDPELISPKAIDIRFQVYRGGIQQKVDFTASADPDRISSTYYFDNVDRKWLFYGDGLVNEQILIIAW